MALTRCNSPTRQPPTLPGKDSIPLLKRGSQVRILPGAQRVKPLTWGFSPTEAFYSPSDGSSGAACVSG